MPSEQQTLALYDRVRAAIAKHGHAVMGDERMDGTGPRSYTVGLSSHGLPELIVLGLRAVVAENLLNRLTHVLRTRAIPAPDELVTGVLDGAVINLMPVHDSAAHLPVADHFYRISEPLPALQVIYPDEHGLMPWHPDSSLRTMPLLGTPPAVLR